MFCKHCDDYTGICTNGDCPMCGDCCPVPDAEGICKYEERVEEVYKLTPKGCACAALMDAKLIDSIDDPAVGVFFDSFQRLMAEHGYIQEADDAT